MKKYIIVLLSAIYISGFSQSTFVSSLKGTVYQLDSTGNKVLLPFANVYWLENGKGVITDDQGHFIIKKPSAETRHKLVVSFIGFQPDTIVINSELAMVEVGLHESRQIKELVILKSRTTSVNSRINMMQSQLITEVGLQKLACCNIGESFESNATIDVGFSDAVSGAKKIRMLGLDGKYSQFLFENIPFMRGPEAGYGLSHIPGPFMSSIQISKGTSSVLNGYESTTGQLNIEYKKPADTELLNTNFFANSEGRFESNFTSGLRLNDRWAGMIFFHASTQSGKLDHNKDGFYDKPLQKQVNFLNRWEYNPDGFFHLQFGLEVLNEKRIGGQLDFTGKENNPENLFGIDLDIEKIRAFAKIGFAFPGNPDQSIGWIHSLSYFSQESHFGIKEYKGKVRNYYSNLIWQTQIKNSGNKLSSGLSFQYDLYDEFFMGGEYLRAEVVPGIFSQYSFSVPEKLVFMAGSRLDFNSKYGTLFTPRFHFKYNLKENFVIRTTLGKSYRSPNIFSENISFLASSREWILASDTKIEKAVNSGISISRHFYLSDQKEASLSVDFYHTEFQDQMILDLDHSSSEVNIYHLDGRSFSNSLQAEFTGELIKSLDLTLAYRYNEVFADFISGLQELPFTSRHKFLFTGTYTTGFDKWRFDLTVQRKGKSRIPDTSDKPIEFQQKEESPAYFIIHTQITRNFKRFELYTGIENVTSYRQKNAIIDPSNPFGENFDATMIWGPLTNRMFYGGLRFRID